MALFIASCLFLLLQVLKEEARRYKARAKDAEQLAARQEQQLLALNEQVLSVAANVVIQLTAPVRLNLALQHLLARTYCQNQLQAADCCCQSAAQAAD
jgi:hypothetical protein